MVDNDAATHLSTYFILLGLSYYESILQFYKPLFSLSILCMKFHILFIILVILAEVLSLLMLPHSSSYASKVILFFKNSTPSLLPVKKKIPCMLSYFRGCLLYVCRVFLCSFFCKGVPESHSLDFMLVKEKS